MNTNIQGDFQIFISVPIRLFRAKEKLWDDLDHDILELYNTLVQVRFATSKTELDIQDSKLYIQVVSRVAKRLQTENLRELGNIRAISNLGEDIPSVKFPFQKLNFGNNSQKVRKSSYQSFFALSNFTGILYFVRSILSGIVSPEDERRQGKNSMNFTSKERTPCQKFPIKLERFITQHHLTEENKKKPCFSHYSQIKRQFTFSAEKVFHKLTLYSRKYLNPKTAEGGEGGSI